MTKRIPLIALAILVGMVGCSKPGKQPVGTPAAQTVVPVQVSVWPVERRDISDTVQVTGALASLNDVIVAVKAAGKIVAVYAREGDVVHAGEIVAQQDTSDLRNSLAAEQANLLAAESRVTQAQTTLTNARTTVALTQVQTEAAIRQDVAALAAAREQASVTREGARPQELKQAQANVQAAASSRTQARSDLKRYQELYREEAISAQQLDQAQSVADSADAQYNSAFQAYSLLRAGNRPQDVRRAQDAVVQAQQELAAAIGNRQQVRLRQEDVATANAGIVSALAAVRQQEAAVRIAQQALSDASIRSPISGVVAERDIDPGMEAAITKPNVMRIVNLNSIYMDAQLPENQFAFVHTGMPVGVNVDALNGRVFQGTITRIYPVASAAGRAFTLRISLRNDGNVLRPQMFARATIVLAMHRNAVVAPTPAILPDSGTAAHVFVDRDAIAARRAVTLGFTDSQFTEIRSGLQPGEKLIIIGQAQVQPGDHLAATEVPVSAAQVAPAN
ncbi:MAG: efflux RND transporter periplasmic adaptor subunit [Armatimonadetes bacterium]|nr:efflux RND transporter periplasmic adaptor subunit [Armatimonadota bacterium]MDE2207505.1 efflux RND transporter periplasmic adaptor subunit [Armatimonadota bacterium]